ncbi:MAG: EamA family transporter [Chitinophagaceae bacterium]|nr:EamA family transporter [Chitinophagaceae bacterium]MCW5927011.1 EamA family transporter [Chitinophagaceae bacterium]
MNSKTKGVVAILCANTIFGLNIPVTKALVSGWMTPTGYTLIRMLFGSLVFWFIGSLRKSEKVTSKDMLIMALGGFLGFVSTQFTFALVQNRLLAVRAFVSI